MATASQAETGAPVLVPIATRPRSAKACAPTLRDAAIIAERVAGDGLPSRPANASRRLPIKSPRATGATLGREGQGVHPAETIRLATFEPVAGPRRPFPLLPGVVRAPSLTTATAASSATAPIPAAIGHVLRPSETFLVATGPVAALPGDEQPAMEAIARAADVRPVALRRGAPGRPPGLPTRLLRAGLAPARAETEAEGAAKAEALPLLASPRRDAAVVLLAPVAMGHAQMVGSPGGVLPFDAAAQVLTAAPPVVLPDAGCENGLLPSRPIQARAVAPYGPGGEAPVLVPIHPTRI